MIVQDAREEKMPIKIEVGCLIITVTEKYLVIEDAIQKRVCLVRLSDNSIQVCYKEVTMIETDLLRSRWGVKEVIPPNKVEMVIFD